MQLLITEITELYDRHFCLAGWCPQTSQMIRPLPNGKFWTNTLLNSLAPGQLIDIRASRKQLDSTFPHSTEDTPILSSPIKRLATIPDPWFGPQAPKTAPTITAAFGGTVTVTPSRTRFQKGAYVSLNSQTNSLAAITIDPKQINFVADTLRLRAHLDDGTQKYSLAVSCHTLRTIYRNGGLPGLTNFLPKTGPFHVRLGLSRTFQDSPLKCFVMLNGLQW